MALVAVVAIAALAALPVSARKAGFVRGIVLNVDGEDYYLAGPADAPDGARDVPGHYWVLAGRNKLVGKHYNTGPFGLPQWWSSDAPDGELLFMVHGIIDVWTREKAERYAARGYVHYHELVSVEDGALHPTHVVWLKHTARTSFNLDPPRQMRAWRSRRVSPTTSCRTGTSPILATTVTTTNPARADDVMRYDEPGG